MSSWTVEEKIISDHKLLVCIYTCEKHRELLHEFHQSVVGRYLRNLAGTKCVEVYANPGISCSTLNADRLILRTEERYEALSLKTHKMMEFCVNHFEFQNLLKIDVTTIMTRFAGNEYKGRKPIDLDQLVSFLKSASFDNDYDGFLLHRRATRHNAENWAAIKGKTISYEMVFGDENMPPYFSGKCYMVSQRFARYISECGHEMAEEHEKYFLGSEDLLVGRMYIKFKEMMSLQGN